MSKKNVLPEGTRDLILDECVIKRSIERDIDGMFESWGYKEVITPTVEFYETFNDSSQSLNEEDMYKFFDNRGRILVLRPDMTIPIARVVQTKLKDAETPLRLRYVSNVFRVHESFGGKTYTFYNPSLPFYIDTYNQFDNSNIPNTTSGNFYQKIQLKGEMVEEILR